MNIKEQAMQLTKAILEGGSITKDIRAQALALHLECCKEEAVEGRTFTLENGDKLFLASGEIEEYRHLMNDKPGQLVSAVKRMRERHGVSLKDGVAVVRMLQ